MYKYLATAYVFVSIFTQIFGFHIDNASGIDGDFAQGLIKDGGEFFMQSRPPFSSEFIATNPFYLMQAAQDTLNFLKKQTEKNNKTVVPEHFTNILTRENIEATLKFIIETIKHDLPSNNFRILDPNFLNKNFKFIKWQADTNSAYSNGIKLGHGGGIRLTSYAIYNVYGSYKKTGIHQCALYQALDQNICKLYTKQQVLKGILEISSNKKKIKPLVWLSRDDFEDALMQGTVIVKMPDSKEFIFIAHQCNGIAYNKKTANPKDQKRFWYFREIKNSKWALGQFKKRFKMRQNVIFAGDIYNLGLGKIIAIKHVNPMTKKHEVRLGVVADTGGAFVKNLYQLDLFAGIFNNRNELDAYLKHLPTQTDAYILYR